MNLQTEQQARQRLIDIINNIKAELLLHHAPSYSCVSDPIAAHLGLRVCEAELDFDEGQYYPDKKLIVLDPRVSDPDRLNFTFFHEITHHLVREDGPLYSFLNEYAQSKADFKSALEDFCDIGAAEFIIPSSDVRDIIAKQGFSIKLIEQFENTYPASKVAIAIQMAQCASHKCFVIICEYGIIPQRHGLHQSNNFIEPHHSNSLQLHTRYTAKSPSVGRYSIGRYIGIPKDHIVDVAYQKQVYINGRDYIPFRNRTQWKVDCEANFYKGKVYAAFNIIRPQMVSALQQSLFDDQ